MADLRSRVQQSLSGSYKRELGGGMSQVFVADEQRLGRKVAMKLLSPELAAGDVDGLPYYTRTRATLGARRSTMGGSWTCGRTPTRSYSRASRTRARGSTA